MQVQKVSNNKAGMELLLCNAVLVRGFLYFNGKATVFLLSVYMQCRSLIINGSY